MAWSQSQTKLFRALLYCYPVEFRHEYGVEMEHVFASRLAHEPHWRLWLETCSDIAVSAISEHLSVLASDLKHELRALRAIPSFTAIVLLVTALGIGAAVSISSALSTLSFCARCPTLIRSISSISSHPILITLVSPARCLPTFPMCTIGNASAALFRASPCSCPGTRV